MYELILTEKPSVSRRIASALADGPIHEEKDYGVAYYQIDHNGKQYLVVSAVGHLFSLKQKTSSWTYPVFDIEWVPIFETNKKAGFTEVEVAALVVNREEVLLISEGVGYPISNDLRETLDLL